MKIFKAYFKILKSMSSTIILYTGIFLALTLIYKSTWKPNTSNDYTDSKPNIMIINNDKDSELSKSFVKYLTSKTNVVDVDINEEAISDALFYRKIVYVVTIPANFGQNFINSSEVKLDIRKAPDSFNTSYIDIIINKYFNIAKTYLAADIDETNIINNIKEDLSLETVINLKIDEKDSNDKSIVAVFFNYLNYVFLAMFIVVIGLITSFFNDDEIKKRNMCSPISNTRINMELIFCNLIVTVAIWFVYIIAALLVYGNKILNFAGVLFIINSFLLAILSLCIGFLVGRTVKNIDAQSAVSNIVSLGSSFLCGAFVPQSILGEGVLKFTKFFPSYWYIKANDLVSNSTNISMIINEYLFCVGIEVIFIVIIIISIIILSRKFKKTI